MLSGYLWVVFREDMVHLSWKLILWPFWGKTKHTKACGKNSLNKFHGKAMMQTYFSKKAGLLAVMVGNNKKQAVKTMGLVSARPGFPPQLYHSHPWVNCLTSHSLSFQIHMPEIVRTPLPFGLLWEVYKVMDLKNVVNAQ